jgi:hypothetical protein
MVASFHDLDFLESNSNENTRIHLYPMWSRSLHNSNIKNLVSVWFRILGPRRLYIRSHSRHQQCSRQLYLKRKHKIYGTRWSFVFRGYMCNSFHASNLQLHDMTACRIIWSDGLFFLSLQWWWDGSSISVARALIGKMHKGNRLLMLLL